MKIRHKQSGVELEGEFVSMGECGHGVSRHYFYPAEPTHNSGSEYSMTEWEAVEPKWVDVTAECRVSDYRDAIGERMLSLYHPETGMNTLHAANGYRLRKVKLYAGYCSTEQQAAFIIEQRQA